MAVSAALFGKVFLSAFNKEINITGDAVKVMLLTSATAPDQDVWQYKQSITTAGTEITGTGYAAGGTLVSSPAFTYDGPTNTTKFAGANVSWTGATFTCRYAIIYDSTPGTDATRPLIGFVDFGADISVTAGTFQITWASTGICTITVA